MIRCVLAVLLLAASAPAHAQQEQPLSTRLLLAGNACTEATGEPSAIISTCQGVLQNLNTIILASPATQHDNNLYWVMASLAHTRIGSAMGSIDRARSARTCTELEESWKALSALKPEASPADYAADMRDMQARAVAPVRLCRSEFGTPSLAPPLP